MMLQMALRRVWIGVATMFVVSVIVFIMTSILPGDVAQIVLGSGLICRLTCATSAGWATWQPAISARPKLAVLQFQI